MRKQSPDRLAIPPVHVIRCPACGRVDAGAREVCPSCYHRGLDDYQTEGTGILQSWTVIRRPPARYKDGDQYTVALVELDAGPMITVRLSETPPDLAIGDRVQHVSTTSVEYNTFERTPQ